MDFHIEHPAQVLMWANAIAATGCFGLALIWAINGQWYSLLQWELATLAVGALCSAVAFLGDLGTHLRRSSQK